MKALPKKRQLANLHQCAYISVYPIILVFVKLMKTSSVQGSAICNDGVGNTSFPVHCWDSPKSGSIFLCKMLYSKKSREFVENVYIASNSTVFLSVSD